MLATDHTGTGASDAGAMPHSKRDRELDPSTPAAKRPMLLHAATAREEHSPATPADGRQESADGGGDGGDGGDGGAGGAGAVSDCTVSDTDKEDGQQQQQEDEEEELERDHDRGHDSDHDDRKDHEGRGQEDTSPRAARGGGLSDYSSAEQPVAAAAATAAQLEGSAEEMQVQALMQNFESIGVPSELITKLQNHVETAREQIMVHLDELLGVLASEKAQIDIAAGLFSTERESQAHAANAQADMQQRQAHTLDDFFKRLKQLKSISSMTAMLK